MSLEQLVQQLLNGISLGSLYALIAIGYTMVYGILRLINFAHGDIFMVGAYVGYYMVVIFYLPWWISAPIALAVTALVGVSIDRVAYRPLRNEPRISLLITAVGVSFFLENLGIVLLGGRPKGFPVPDFLQNPISIGGVNIVGVSVWVPLLSVAILAILLYIIYRTKIGLAMRSVSKDMETTRLMGVDINRIISYTFAIGSALAAAGGIMWAFKYPQLNPLMGIYPGWKAFTAAVIGGIGNITGAMLGGLIIGLVEILTVAFLPGLTGYRDAFVFGLLILFLIIRPTGIMGEPLKEKV